MNTLNNGLYPAFRPNTKPRARWAQAADNTAGQ